MIGRILNSVAVLIVILTLSACGDSGTDQSVQNTIEKPQAPGVSRMQAPEHTPPISEGPTEVAVELGLEGKPVAISRIYECVAMPGRGLGFSAFTDDHVGDGSAGVRVGGGFEGDRGKVLITYRGKKWVTEPATAALDFERIDTRTEDGRSFVTISASGTAIAGADELPFTLGVTCAPQGAWTSQTAK